MKTAVRVSLSVIFCVLMGIGFKDMYNSNLETVAAVFATIVLGITAFTASVVAVWYIFFDYLLVAGIWVFTSKTWKEAKEAA